MVTDDDLKQMRRIIAAPGYTLRVDLRDPLVDGLYVINVTGKWVMSIYRNVKEPQNDIEVAIDVQALVWPGETDYRLAVDWLEMRREELEHIPSGVHATKPPGSFRIGLKLQRALSFLELLHLQLSASPSQRGEDLLAKRFCSRRRLRMRCNARSTR